MPAIDLVPEDETCFLLFDAPSADLVAEAVHRAGLRHEHISAATSTTVAAASAAATHPKGTTMTITTQLTDYTELRDKQQKVWSSGDYNKIAALTVPVSEHLVDHVGVMPGERVLESPPAPGTSPSPPPAARRGDRHRLRPRAARHRAAPRPGRGAGHPVVQSDAEDLPYGDATFDVVLSAIGVMFAADHARAARELVRVCRPGARIGLASWTPEGFVGGMLAAVGRHVTPPAGAPAAHPLGRRGRGRRAPRGRGDRRGVGDRDRPSALRPPRRTSPTCSSPLPRPDAPRSAASRLDEDGRASLRADLVELADSFDKDAGNGVIVDWEYRIVTATRR